ncbi:MAG: DUF2142 domain-containing protein [Chloroflexota bacterium]
MAVEATTELVEHPVARPRALPAWALPAALIVALAGLALLGGLALARPAVRLAVSDAGAERVLRGFSDLETSGDMVYRWSLPKSALVFGGLERGPVLLTLRMSAPRPGYAPYAVTYLTDDEWRLGDFVVTTEQRRYQLLLPPAAAPVKLRSTPFVPGENDRRQLGVAVTHISAAPTALTPAPEDAWTTLGAPRAATLLLLPLVAYGAMLGLARASRRVAAVAAIAAALPFPALIAARPLRAADLLPETWVLPGALAAVLGLAAAADLARAPRRHIARALPRLGERAQAALLLAAALAQGLLFLLLMPPWQHYDEPAHFEYARLIADRGARPAYGEYDLATRREITASMAEHGFYDPEIPAPPLLSDAGLYLSGGGTATGHQPPYYLLVSLPLRLARHLDVTSQLYLARAVSLIFYLVAIAAAIGAARDLAPPGSTVRWLLPLGVVLCASYADLMTAVNNDGMAAAFFSLFLWGAARTVRRGLSWWRVGGMLAAALASALVKNTGAVALALLPCACVVALWAERGWRWRWLVGGAAGMAAPALVAAVAWDDAAFWYRWSWPSQPLATRAARADAPLGEHALRLTGLPGAEFQQLSNPVLPGDLQDVRGRRITVGAWLWAERPTLVRQGVLVNTGASDTLVGEVIEIDATPRFVSWIYSVPEDVQRLQYAVAIEGAPDAPLDVFVDGAVLARGRYALDQAPSFDDARAQAGEWGGRRFENLLRNASAEESGPRFRPWLDQGLARYARRAPSTTLVSVLDAERTWQLTFLTVAPSMVELFFSRFGWGWSPMPGWGWALVFRAFAAAALAGCVLWLLRPRPGSAPRLRPALVFLGLAALVVWGNAVMRIHPLIDVAQPLTSARYGFPAIIPTVLALSAGWLALWPARLRGYALALLIAGMLALEALAVARIWAYFYG